MTFANVSREEALLREAISRQPNTALLSIILTFGTFFIAEYLKKFRNSHFLGRSVSVVCEAFFNAGDINDYVSMAYHIDVNYVAEHDSVSEF